MSYLATLTFDLHDADSEDYACVAARLAEIGLKPELKGKTGMSALPANTFAGTFLSNDRAALLKEIDAIFSACKVKGRVFLATGDDWGWSTRDIS